ncbi:MAG: hypothetical protein QM621_10075 [Aeromicrobium sp.]|uniref:hypothetical protein n=1 Tax=Aeromicrobium sp. TaxID=1871063 RepID=UPI0039E5A935
MTEARERAERLRRAAELLGDLEPSGTRDDTDEGWGDRSGPGGRDQELLRDVPPHHG